MLYIVPTPIGNLDDITLRAKAILSSADLVLAEDTRNTGRLLRHLGIETKMRPFHAHNEHRAVEAVLRDLDAGMDIALVSDAGTPGISDPAYLLVRGCIENDIGVSCLPGPTAFVPALVMSGFPIDRFVFEGFLPHKKGRKTRWEQIANNELTTVLYESPHRLGRFLKEAQKYLPKNRRIAVVREISKIFESVHRGSADELITFFENNPNKAKGEIVIVLAKE